MLTPACRTENGPPARRATARSTRNRSTAPTPPSSITPAQTAIVMTAPRTRRTSAVARCTASNPTTMLAHGVADRQAVVVVFEHLQRLDLHGRERGQPAAQAGAEQRAPITRQRQPLQQSGGEVAQQERADDVDGERRPRPARGVGGPRACSGRRARRCPALRRRTPRPTPGSRAATRSYAPLRRQNPFAAAGSARRSQCGRIGAMAANPRAGQPAQPEDLIDLPHLVTAYYTIEPDPDDVAQQVVFGTSGHRGSRLDGAFNEAHILATTQAIVEYRAAQGTTGPLFIGRDTHGLSEPAWVSALEVLAANDVVAMIDSADRYTPTPAVSHAILTYNRGRIDRSGRRDRRHPVAQPAPRRRLQVQPAQRRPGRHRRDRRNRQARQRDSATTAEDVKRVPLARALQTAQRHDYLDAYIDDLPNVVDMHVIRKARRPDRRRPARRGQRRLLGRDRRAAQPRADRGQSAGRRDVAVHDAGHRRQDPDGLQLAERDGVADRQPRQVSDRDRQRRRLRPARHRHARRRPAEPESLSRRGDRLPLHATGRPGRRRRRSARPRSARRSSTAWSPGWAASWSRCRSGSSGSSTD